MRTVIVGPRPPEIDALIARRHALGHDTHDEVWEGEYHMNAAPHSRHALVAWRIGTALEPHLPIGFGVATELNVGWPDDFPVPDLAVIRESELALYLPTAAAIVEVVSPGDESRLKFAHYARCGVDEVFIVEPEMQAIEIYVRRDATNYNRRDRSELTGRSAVELGAAVRWPP